MKKFKHCYNILGNSLLKSQRFYFTTQQPLVIPEIEETILNVIKMTAKCNQAKLHNKATFGELGFDSLDVVELIVAFEEHLGFDIDNEDAENNINNVFDAIVVFSKRFKEINEKKNPEE
jgi:acyl carrier protein